MNDRPMPSAELRARVLAAARARPAASRTTWQRRGAVRLAVGVALSVGVLLAIGGPSADGRPAGYFSIVLGLWAVVAMAATWFGVTRGRSMLGRPAWARVAVAVLTPVALFATAVAAGAAWPSGVVGHSDLRHHAVCVTCTLVMALGPFVAFLAMRRGSDPVAPRLMGAALGAAAGAWGAACIELRCGLATVDHVVLGHVLPVAVISAVGFLLGARWLAVRSVP